MFDLIAGTSTGGILACGLVAAAADGRPCTAPSELADLYITEARRSSTARWSEDHVASTA